MVAVCYANGRDLAEAVVSVGLARALPHFSDAYVSAEASARERGVGIWTGTFQEPAAYRVAHPIVERRPTVNVPVATYTVDLGRSQAPPGVYFRNCNEARAAGAAPLYRGQPGYRPEMDGDSDGIACEPYRPRR